MIYGGDMDESQNTLVRYARLPEDASVQTETPRLPREMCRACWREHLVRRDQHLWLEHIGPLDQCAHMCHDDTFLGSTS